MYKIYHNPRCRKSRAGLQYLQEKGAEHEVVEYLKDTLSVDELTDIMVKLNKKPADVIRKQEEYFKKELKGKKFTDEEWIRIMVENPKLIQRPIIVKNYKAVIGDPVENIDEIL